MIDVLMVLGVFFVGFMTGIVCAAIYEVKAERERRQAARMQALAGKHVRHLSIDYDHDGHRIDPEAIHDAAWDPKDAA